MLSNVQWLKEGINWEKTDSVILGVLTIIPDVISFKIIKHGEGGYSIYHEVYGSTGQKQFDTEQQIKACLERQLIAKQEYRNLVGRGNALKRRIQPIQIKIAHIKAQINALY